MSERALPTQIPLNPCSVAAECVVPPRETLPEGLITEHPVCSKPRWLAEVPAAQWPCCLSGRPGFVHINVMLYTSQWHLAPVAHSCFSHFQPQQSQSSSPRAPPGFVIIPAYVGLTHPSAGLTKKLFKGSMHKPESWNLNISFLLQNSLCSFWWYFLILS